MLLISSAKILVSGETKVPLLVTVAPAPVFGADEAGADGAVEVPAAPVVLNDVLGWVTPGLAAAVPNLDVAAVPVVEAGAFPERID